MFVKSGFHCTLLGIGKICDADCRVEFTKDAVVVYIPQQQPILSLAWHNWSQAVAHIVESGQANLPRIPETSTKPTLQEFSAYYLPSVEVLVKYFHAATGFPVRDT